MTAINAGDLFNVTLIFFLSFSFKFESEKRFSGNHITIDTEPSINYKILQSININVIQSYLCNLRTIQTITLEQYKQKRI